MDTTPAQRRTSGGHYSFGALTAGASGLAPSVSKRGDDASHSALEAKDIAAHEEAARVNREVAAEHVAVAEAHRTLAAATPHHADTHHAEAKIHDAAAKRHTARADKHDAAIVALKKQAAEAPQAPVTALDFNPDQPRDADGKFGSGGGSGGDGKSSGGGSGGGSIDPANLPKGESHIDKIGGTSKAHDQVRWAAIKAKELGKPIAVAVNTKQGSRGDSARTHLGPYSLGTSPPKKGDYHMVHPDGRITFHPGAGKLSATEDDDLFDAADVLNAAPGDHIRAAIEHLNAAFSTYDAADVSAAETHLDALNAHLLAADADIAMLFDESQPRADDGKWSDGGGGGGGGGEGKSSGGGNPRSNTPRGDGTPAVKVDHKALAKSLHEEADRLEKKAADLKREGGFFNKHKAEVKVATDLAKLRRTQAIAAEKAHRDSIAKTSVADDNNSPAALTAAHDNQPAAVAAATPTERETHMHSKLAAYAKNKGLDEKALTARLKAACPPAIQEKALKTLSTEKDEDVKPDFLKKIMAHLAALDADEAESEVEDAKALRAKCKALRAQLKALRAGDDEDSDEDEAEDEDEAGDDEKALKVLRAKCKALSNKAALKAKLRALKATPIEDAASGKLGALSIASITALGVAIGAGADAAPDAVVRKAASDAQRVNDLCATFGVTSLSALEGKMDAWKASADEGKAAVIELNAIKAQKAHDVAALSIETAEKQGRLTPAKKQIAEGHLSAKNYEKLNAFLEGCDPIPALANPPPTQLSASQHEALREAGQHPGAAPTGGVAALSAIMANETVRASAKAVGILDNAAEFKSYCERLQADPEALSALSI